MRCLLLAAALGTVTAFQAPVVFPARATGWTSCAAVQDVTTTIQAARTARTQLAMAGEDKEALERMSRAARKAGPNDRVVEIEKPMGLLLEEDESGDVYVAEIFPGGNAEKSKKVRAGDRVAFISATFGDEVWSARGAGLSRVRSAIKIRQGRFCTLVLENANEGAYKAAEAKRKEQDARAAKESEQARKDRLLAELEEDTKKQKAKGWFGLW